MNEKMLGDDFWSRRIRKKDKPSLDKGFGPENIKEFFSIIEDMMDSNFIEMTERASEDPKKGKILQNEEKRKRFGSFVYGYCITIGPDGKPRISELGNLRSRKCAKKPKSIDKRDLLLDIFSMDTQVQIVMELPAVSKKDINVNATKQEMTVVVDTLQYTYYKSMEMPCNIDPESVETKYINGVLVIKANKT